MIIARGTSGGEELLLLGITRGNVEELLKGNPMRLTPATHGAGVPLGWTIAIVFGETEADIARALKAAGAIGPDTKLTAMPNGNDPQRPA